MSAAPPADTDNTEGVLSDISKSMRTVVLPEPYKTTSTGMLAESAPCTETFCAPICDMGSLNDTWRMLLHASYAANDALGCSASSYEIAVLISSGLVPWISFAPPAGTAT